METPNNIAPKLNPINDFQRDLESIRAAAENVPDLVQKHAETLRDESALIYLQGIASRSAMAASPMKAVQEYLAEFCRDACGGDPKHDPLSRTMAEQIVIAHHLIGRLVNDGLEANDVKLKNLYLSQAQSWTGELRRMTQALEQRVAELRRNGLRVRNSPEENRATIRTA